MQGSCKAGASLEFLRSQYTVIFHRLLHEHQPYIFSTLSLNKVAILVLDQIKILRSVSLFFFKWNVNDLQCHSVDLLIFNLGGQEVYWHKYYEVILMLNASLCLLRDYNLAQSLLTHYSISLHSAITLLDIEGKVTKIQNRIQSVNNTALCIRHKQRMNTSYAFRLSLTKASDLKRRLFLFCLTR